VYDAQGRRVSAAGPDVYFVVAEGSRVVASRPLREPWVEGAWVRKVVVAR